MNPHEGRQGDGAMGRIGARPFWVLGLSIAVRAIHLVGAGVVLAVFLHGDALPELRGYSVLATASGFLLLGSEWLRHRQLWRELAGVVTLVKIILLGAVFHGLFPGRETMLLLFVAAAVAAHAPKTVRHRLLF